MLIQLNIGMFGSTYRRDESSMTKKELTMRGSGGSSRMRAGDRDLREEIRQVSYFFVVGQFILSHHYFA